MSDQSLMQQALGVQWAELPPVLRAHYPAGAAGISVEEGALDIDYPAFMQWPLNALRLLGALANRRGKAIPTTVKKWDGNHGQEWDRRIRFADGREILFHSHVVHAGGNELIEYVKSCLGLRMAVSVEDGKLHYRSAGYELKLGRLQFSLPEWLALGKATIVESAVDDTHFAMDFRLRHPLFGQIYSYAGVFRVNGQA
jgi:hypothetical protein